MAKWNGNDRIFHPVSSRHNWKWDCFLGPSELWKSFKSSGPLSFSDFDLWEKSLLKSQSSAWSLGLPQSDPRSKISISQSQMKHSDLRGIRRWRSVSSLAPGGHPASQSSQEVELQTALEKSSKNRAELVKRLRETHTCLDTQAELLKTKETQLQHCQSTTQLLELKRKQLAKALSALNALEQEKEAAQLNNFEESQRRAELQDKVLQLERDMLKMKSSLESKRDAQTSHHSRTISETKEGLIKETQKHVGNEMKRLKEALRDAEERVEMLESEKDCAVQEVSSIKEGQSKLLSQVMNLKQKLSTSIQAQGKLREQLSESCSSLGQLQLEKDWLSNKALRLEDNLEDMKAKLSTALADRDQLVQKKADLHQKTHSLELQLQRAKMGREGFTEQVCELHSELTQAKSQASRHQQNTLLMKEDLHSAIEVNEKLSSDLAKTTERLQVTLRQLHELEAEKLIYTKQIAALEVERLQLIGEKEELIKAIDQGDQEKLRKLKEECHQLTEKNENLEHEKQHHQTHCQVLEKKLQNMEAEFKSKEEILQHAKLKLEQELEEIKTVAVHWNERWMDVAMTLQFTQTELEKTKKEQRESDAISGEVTGMAQMVEKLKEELKDRQNQITVLLEEKTHLKTELDRVTVTKEDCSQQVELDKKHALEEGLWGNPVSLEEVNGELIQVKAELQSVLDMLKSRDSELEKQNQELQCACGQLDHQISEVQRLEKQLTEKDQELKARDLTLKNVIMQKDSEKNEAQTKITALQKELAEIKELKTSQDLSSDSHGTKAINSIKPQLEESKRSDHVVEKLHSLKPLQQSKDERGSSATRKEKHVTFDLKDTDQQRRLITQQLKSLFKERENLGDRGSPVLLRKSGSKLDHALKSRGIKDENVVSSKRKMQHDVGDQQGAGGSAEARPERSQLDPTSSENRQQQQQSIRSLEPELSCSTLPAS